MSAFKKVHEAVYVAEVVQPSRELEREQRPKLKPVIAPLAPESRNFFGPTDPSKYTSEPARPSSDHAADQPETAAPTAHQAPSDEAILAHYITNPKTRGVVTEDPAKAEELVRDARGIMSDIKDAATGVSGVPTFDAVMESPGFGFALDCFDRMGLPYNASSISLPSLAAKAVAQGERSLANQIIMRQKYLSDDALFTASDLNLMRANGTLEATRTKLLVETILAAMVTASKVGDRQMAANCAEYLIKTAIECDGMEFYHDPVATSVAYLCNSENHHRLKRILHNLPSDMTRERAASLGQVFQDGFSRVGRLSPDGSSRDVRVLAELAMTISDDLSVFEFKFTKNKETGEYESWKIEDRDVIVLAAALNEISKRTNPETGRSYDDFIQLIPDRVGRPDSKNSKTVKDALETRRKDEKERPWPPSPFLWAIERAQKKNGQLKQ